MKGFYRLLNFEFSTMSRALLILCLGLITTQAFFINLAMKDYVNIYNRFEVIYSTSGCIIIFLVYFAVLCVYFLKSIYMYYWGSKSIYTLLSLPVKREVVYFSKLAAFFITFLSFFAAQLISVLLSYSIVVSKVTGFEEGKYLMNNGLFLAFIRSGFLRIILPLTTEGIVSTASIAITIIITIYYGALCERSKRYWGFIFIAAAVFLIIHILNYRMSKPVYHLEYKNLYIYSGMLLSLSGFFLWHSIKLVKTGAIV